MIKKINLKKIKLFLKRLPEILAGKPFFTLLALIVLVLVLGAFIFHRFSLLFERRLAPFEEEPLEFREELCRKFLETLDEKERRFEETELKSYFDLFRYKLTE